jgi:hypothetical protein
MSMIVVASVVEAASDGTVFPRRTVQRKTVVRPLITSAISPQDSLRFLGYLPPASAGQAAFGDSDQDGADEMIIQVNDPMIGFTVRNLEYQSGDVYQETILWSDTFDPYEICDLDRDGKREVLGQYGYWLHLYE